MKMTKTILTASAKADYLCFLLINAEVKNTMDEHEDQKRLRANGLQNLGAEEYNRSEWKEHQTTAQKIRKRLNSLSFVLQGISASMSVSKEIEKIRDNQAKIYRELREAPKYIPMVGQRQLDFVSDLNMTNRLMAGIVLSVGVINQMEKAERKTLLDYAVQEMRNLRIRSSQTLALIRAAKMRERNRRNYLAHWANKDKKLIGDIIANAKKY